MATASNITDEYPHIATCDAEGEREPYVLDTGLAVWEIAWLARAYDGDPEAIALHTNAERRLIEEGLRYASDHADEIEAQIACHTERPLEELLELLPGMRVIDVDLSAPHTLIS